MSSVYSIDWHVGIPGECGKKVEEVLLSQEDGVDSSVVCVIAVDG